MALDIDIEALAEARRRDPALVAVVGDLHHLPFRSDGFDLVWNSSTVEHLPERERAIAEMARVAKPGGFVFVGVPFRGGPLGVQRWMADTPAGVWIGPVFSREELAALLRAGNLKPQATLIFFLRFFVGTLARK